MWAVSVKFALTYITSGIGLDMGSCVYWIECDSLLMLDTVVLDISDCRKGGYFFVHREIGVGNTELT